jgi:hypothetical protein
VLALAAAESCARGGDEPRSEGTASADAEVRVEVVEDPGADSWTVTYSFAEPVAGLVFQRGHEPWRGEEWELLDAGLSWGVEGDKDTVVVSGAPVDRIALRFDSNFRAFVKDYELNASYTDGGRLLYTGHLSVQLGADGSVPDHRWRFRTDPGRQVALLDLAGEAELEWVEPKESTGNGTYVYLGPSRPAVAERSSHVIDSELPQWMRDQVDKLLPLLFDRYAEITGVELDFRPLVLLSYRPTDVSGLVFMGGTLDGLVQIAAEGRAWAEQSREGELMWLDRTAHEIFHFWTGQMFTLGLSGAEEWITEGGADHFALLTARELGFLDSAAYRRRLVENANQCLVGLGGQPLLRSTELGNFDNLYQCGSTIWAWAESAGRRTSAGDDPHAFVRVLLAEADAGDRRLTSYRFLESLHQVTGDPWPGAPLAQLLFEGVANDAEDLFASQMRTAGVEVDLVAPEDASLPGWFDLPAEPDGSWSRLLRVGEATSG